MVQFKNLLASYGITATLTNKDGNEYFDFTGDPEKLVILQNLIKKCKTSQMTFKSSNQSKDKSFGIYEKKLKGSISKLFSPLRTQLIDLINKENATKKPPKSDSPTVETKEKSENLVDIKAIASPTLVIELDVEGWKSFLHSGFCYAQEINVEYKDKCFVIDLSNVPTSLNLLLEKRERDSYDVDSDTFEGQMVSRLEKHLGNYASVTRKGDVLYIKPDDKYPQVTSIKGDLYANISDYIANAKTTKAQPKKKPLITTTTSGNNSKTILSKLDQQKKDTPEVSQNTTADERNAINAVLDIIKAVTCKSFLPHFVSTKVNKKNNKHFLEVTIDQRAAEQLAEFEDPMAYFNTLADAINSVKPETMKVYKTDEGHFKLVINMKEANILTALSSKDVSAKIKTKFFELLCNVKMKKKSYSVGIAQTEYSKDDEEKMPEKPSRKPQEADIVNSMINTVKDVVKNPIHRENLLQHLAVLSTLKPEDANANNEGLKDRVDRLRYLFHAFRSSMLLGTKDKYQKLNYQARCALRHKFQNQSFAELFAIFNPTIAPLYAYAQVLKERGTNIQFYKIKGDEKEKIMEKTFKCYAEIIQNSGTEDKTMTEDSPAQIKSWQDQVDEIEQNPALSDVEKREAIVMLHILIGKNISQKATVSGEIYRQTGHKGWDKPVDDFVKEMYGLHREQVAAAKQNNAKR